MNPFRPALLRVARWWRGPQLALLFTLRLRRRAALTPVAREKRFAQICISRRSPINPCATGRVRARTSAGSADHSTQNRDGSRDLQNDFAAALFGKTIDQRTCTPLTARANAGDSGQWMHAAAHFLRRGVLAAPAGRAARRFKMVRTLRRIIAKSR